MTALSMPGPQPASGDLLAELLHLVRDTEAAAKVAQRDARRSEKNRVGMLYIHSLAALMIAPLFALTTLGTPAFAAMREVPGAPYSPAALLAVGGLILGLSAAGAHRVMAFVGLGLLAVWYALMATTFCVSLIVWTVGQHPHSLADVINLLDAPGRPTMYAVPLYAHFCAVMIRHMVTLRGKALDAKALDL